MERTYRWKALEGSGLEVLRLFAATATPFRERTATWPLPSSREGDAHMSCRYRSRAHRADTPKAADSISERSELERTP
jgi:hypothetical protein